MNQNVNMDSRHFCQLKEQLRLSYVYLIKMHIQIYKKYELFKRKFNNDEAIKCIPSVDLYFYDATGKINWNNIQPLMPYDIEKKIKKEYGVLSENEIKLYCLLLFDVPLKDITDILSYTQRSIHSITHKIKQKTGIKNIKSNLKSLLLYEKIE